MSAISKRSKRTKSLAGMACAAAMLSATISDDAAAKVLFYNSGTNASTGWSGSNLDPPGSLATDTNIKFRGTGSLRARVAFDGSYRGRYHAMRTKKNVGFKAGATRWLGFALYVDSSNGFTGQSAWPLQLIAPFGNNIGSLPTVSLEVQGYGLGSTAGTTRRLVLTRRFGKIGDQKPFPAVATTVNGNLQTGRWYNIVMKLKISGGADGRMEIWIDGDKAGDIAGPNYISGSTVELAGDFGLYATDWYQDTVTTAASPRTLYLDEIRIGDSNSSYAEVDPAQ
jgi:hypothetical protein